MENTDKDFNVRKALAWSACHKLRKMWASTLSKRVKIRLFIATVESVLLYGAETWTIIQTMIKQLEFFGWPLMSHGNNTYPTYNYMVNYRQYPPKYNKEECGSLGIVSDTMMKSPTNLSCGSQRMGMQTGEGKQ